MRCLTSLISIFFLGLCFHISALDVANTQSQVAFIVTGKSNEVYRMPISSQQDENSNELFQPGNLLNQRFIEISLSLSPPSSSCPLS